MGVKQASTGAGRASSSSRRLDSLTGLRFVAAMTVVLYHYNLLLAYPAPWPLLRGQGRSAVGLFFVLSGFVLTYTYHHWFEAGHDRLRAWSFARARFARVYPMHVAALLMMTTLILYLRWSYPAVVRGHEGAGFTEGVMLRSWLTNLFLIQVYFPTRAHENLWNTPAWSIACEAVFYALFPFFLAHCLRYFKTVASLAAIGVALYTVELSAALVLAAWLCRLPDNVRDTAADFIGYRLPPFRVWEFLIGCVLGALFLLSTSQSHPEANWIGRSHLRNGLLLGGIAWVAAAALVGTGLKGDPATVVGFLQLYALYTPGFGAIILCLAGGKTFLSPLLENRVILLLGEASYSLYIIHWIPLYALVYARGLGTALPVSGPGAAITGSVGMSLIFWRTIEVPLRKTLRGRG